VLTVSTFNTFVSCTILQKLVAGNKDVLVSLRTNFDKPEIMKEQFKKLQRKYECVFSEGGHCMVQAVD
jgi:Membrane-associated apoptosis protein.